MTSAGMGRTNPAAGVIATSPATAPEIAPSALARPFLIHSAALQLIAAAAVAKCVATNALVASEPAESALPALNPDPLGHGQYAPKNRSTGECGVFRCCGNPVHFRMDNPHPSGEAPDL